MDKTKALNLTQDEKDSLQTSDNYKTNIKYNTSCGSFVKASITSSEPDIQAAKCKGVIPPGPTRFGGKIYLLDVSQ